MRSAVASHCDATSVWRRVGQSKYSSFSLAIPNPAPYWRNLIVRLARTTEQLPFDTTHRHQWKS